MTAAHTLGSLPTPSLVLDEGRMLRNVSRLRRHLDGLGVPLRPHLKTVKSVEAARRVLAGGHGPATVSTLKEAEVFASAGVRDILYAVGIAPQKLSRVLALRAAGCDLSVVLELAGTGQGRGGGLAPGRRRHPGADRDRLGRPPVRFAAR